jgi:hypothetical protein
MIRTPKKGNLTSFKEFITETPMVVKIYAISFILKLLVLNRRIAKTANMPNAKLNSMKTVLNKEQMKKIVIPIRKKVKRYFSFLEYLKYMTRIRKKRKTRFIANLSIIPQKAG